MIGPELFHILTRQVKLTVEKLRVVAVSSLTKFQELSSDLANYNMCQLPKLN